LRIDFDLDVFLERQTGNDELPEYGSLLTC